jgi:hypothetical protein
MKKIFTTGIAVLFVSASFCQKVEESQVPSGVMNNFKARFANATGAKWEKEDTVYASEFLMNESPTEAEFNEKGDWLNTEWKISIDYTPKAIKDYVNTNYPKYKLKELSVTEFPVDGKLYVAEIATKKDCYELYFSLKNEFKKAVKEVCNKENKCCKKKDVTDKKATEVKK